MKFFRIPFQPDDDSGFSEARTNRLQKYIHDQSVQDMSRLAAEIGPEVRQLIGANVQALLGYLPAAEFNTSVTASKENLQNLLASAMLTGYFMHAMETRMHLDTALAAGEEALRDPASLFGSVAADTVPETAAELDDFLSQLEAQVHARQQAAETVDEAAERVDLAEEPGRFIGVDELETETEPTEKLNIQLEISTRMNRSELARLLRELRDFRGRLQDDEPFED